VCSASIRKRDTVGRSISPARASRRSRQGAQRSFCRKPDKGSDFDVDFRIVLPDGAIKYIRSTGHPVFNASGDIVEYFGIAMDVTQQHDAQAALRRSEGYLAERRDWLIQGVGRGMCARATSFGRKRCFAYLNMIPRR